MTTAADLVGDANARVACLNRSDLRDRLGSSLPIGVREAHLHRGHVSPRRQPLTPLPAPASEIGPERSLFVPRGVFEGATKQPVGVGRSVIVGSGSGLSVAGFRVQGRSRWTTSRPCCPPGLT
jgi:hypothetical protein